MTGTLELRLWIASGIALAATLMLGYFVAHAASLWRVDVEAAALRGSATSLASALTLTGRALPLLGLALFGIAATVVWRGNWIAASAIFATQLLSQAGSEFLKRSFGRARPDAWLVHKELGFSYPSGHAATAVVFYLSWAVLVWLTPMRIEAKIALVALLSIWAIGIDWSRMALGAHYPTDVLGGTLFGTACACAMWALLIRFSVA